MHSPSPIEITAIPAFADNYIWALCKQGQCIVVDPGDAAPVLAFLSTNGMQLAGILITHRHNDHIGGVPSLCAAHSVPVYGPPSIACVTHPITEGDLYIQALAATLAVRFIPGHTEEHIAYVLPRNVGAALFCGDTLFSAGCGRLLGGTASQLLQSLHQLKNLDDTTQVYCTHEYTLTNLAFAQQIEPNNQAIASHIEKCRALRTKGVATLPSNIGLERRINPFLRCTEDTVIESAAAISGTSLDDELAVFSVLRAARNEFRV